MAVRGVSSSSHTVSPKSHRIFLWQSKSREGLSAVIDRFRSTVAERQWGTGVEHSGPSSGVDHRLAVVAADAGDLDEKLGMALARLEGIGGDFAFPQGIHYRSHSDSTGKVAFMFPGQGSHRVGMVEGLSRVYPGADEFWKVADAVLGGEFDRPLSEYVFPTGMREGFAVDALTQTHVAQPAIGAGDMVVHHVLTDLGVHADMCVGHSYGEYAALSAAGALSFEDLMRLSAARGRAIRCVCRGREGAMLALAVTREAAERIVSGCVGIVVANVNGPAQTVVSGPKEEVDSLYERCTDEGVKATRLHVAAAFHSPVLDAAREPLRRILDETPFSRARTPVYSNTTAEPYPVDPESMRNGLVQHLTTPVRFMDAILNMYRDGARVFVEVGPGSTLAGLAGGTLKGKEAVIVGVDHRDGLFGLLNALARLFVVGVPWSIDRLHERVFGRVGASRDQAVQRLKGGTSAERSLPRVDRPHGIEPSSSDVDAALQRHQTLMRLFVESQAKVMTQYLRGREAPTPAASKNQSVLEIAPVPTDETGSSDVIDTGDNDVADGDTIGPIIDELRSMVASLTGYPVDILDSDLDLEADLGIDSIKRVEILVELMQRPLGLGEMSDDERKAFSQLTTLAAMAEHLHVVGLQSSGSREIGSETASRAAPEQLDDAAHAQDLGSVRPARYIVEWRGSRLVANDRPRKGRVIVDGPEAELGGALAAALSAGHSGLRAVTFDEAVAHGDSLNDVVGYVHLDTFRAPANTRELRDSAGVIRDDLFKMVSNLQALEEPLRSSRGFVVVAVEAATFSVSGDAEANPLVGGHVGALKSVAQEWPEVDCRTVEVPKDTDNVEIARILMSELTSEDELVEVAYSGKQRRAPSLQAAETKPKPAEYGVQIEEGDVILVTGGGRGITAEVAAALAARWRPVLVVVGRTVPTAEHGRYCGVTDMAELKREIAKTLDGSGQPVSVSSIETTYRSIIHQRELAENLQRLREQTAETHYMVADAGDGESLGRVVTETYRKFGRIDGVIHGAGVIEDRLIGDKDLRSFERVLLPKVDGALALVGSLRLDELKFLCFFSSTATLLGNAGQSDYTAANETLNRLGRWLNLKTHARVFSMIWGPWEPGVGMVDSLLARRFRERGVPLIDREYGAEAFIDEIRLGAKEDAEVVFA